MEIIHYVDICGCYRFLKNSYSYYVLTLLKQNAIRLYLLVSSCTPSAYRNVLGYVSKVKPDFLSSNAAFCISIWEVWANISVLTFDCSISCLHKHKQLWINNKMALYHDYHTLISICIQIHLTHTRSNSSVCK